MLTLEEMQTYVKYKRNENEGDAGNQILWQS